MKKILVLLILVSSFANAQYSINGTMTPPLKSDWVILYKVEGAKQKFVKNTTIKIDSVTVDGKKRAIGNFEFSLPENAESGVYRVTYRMEAAGFLDFIFNKENVKFSFNPDYPDESVVFSSSKENILYTNYLEAIAKGQQKLDSVQIQKLQNPEADVTKAYTKAYKNLNTIQEKYLKKSKNSYVAPFINASFRSNAPVVQTDLKMYMANMSKSFFNKIDFTNKTLLNSSFLVDRITDYVFYVNVSNDKKTQQKLYKSSIDTVLAKITDIAFKKDVIAFLIEQFELSKNIQTIDYLFKNHYNKLPESLQDKKFITEKEALFAAEVGRIAPDFSWKEGKKTLKLSTLNSAENYVLVFWSTDCSHCLREIPELHTFMKGSKKAKVIAFSLEKEAFIWKNYIINLYDWHNVLGLGKWENKIARTYQIFSTPTYFILDKNKKIIAKPEKLEDLKKFFSKK
jgi:thiol-disulfide isomerase/thioredoxin